MLLRTLARHRASLMLTGAIALACTVFLCLYASMQDGLRRQLSQMAEELPVTARVSNEAGTYTSMLEIRADMLDAVNATGISETTYAALDLLLRDGLQSRMDFDRRYLDWEGFTSATAATTLEGLVDNPEFAPGYSMESLQTDGPFCLLSRKTAEEKALSPGDRYFVTLYRTTINRSTRAHRLGTAELTVIGVFDTEASGVSCYLSDELARRLYRENNTLYTYQTASLRMTDPMRLNEWKQAAHRDGFRPVNVTADPVSTAGVGLTVYDEVFINAVTPIMQNLRVYSRLYAAIYAVIVFIGGLVSYLLVNSRRGEIALFRTLGMRKAALTGGLLLEHLLPCIAGVAAGSLVLAPSWPAAVSLAGFVVCYMAGCTVSILLVNREKVLRMLAQAQ